MPIPIISPDTFDYYAIVQNLINGSFKGLITLPQGYIFFLYLMEFITAKTFYILIIQNIISLLVCFFLISIIAKFYRSLVIIVAIALAVYMMDSYSLRYDFALLSESLYRNSLLIIAGLFILIINSQKKEYWILFSIFLIFPPLLRSNGLYIYFLPILFALYLLKNKVSTKYYFLLFFPIFILNIIWSAFNYSTEKVFLPGNPHRFNSVVNYIYGNKHNIKSNISVLDNLCCKASLFKDLTVSSCENKPQFYFTFLAGAYSDFYISDIIHDTAYKYKDWTLPIEIPLKKLALKEFYTEPNKYQEVIADFNVKTSKSLWLKTYHFYYKIHSLLFNSYLLLLLFFILFFISTWKYIFNKFVNTDAFLIFSLCNIHLMAILSLTFFGWLQTRYVYVSEFIIYLTIALSPLLFTKNKENSKTYAE